MPTTNTNDLGRVSFKDVAIAFMTGGVNAAASMLNNPACANPYKTGLKACSFLADLQQEKADLERYIVQFKPTGEGKGRTALAAGEAREYLVQQVKAQDGSLSDTFIRCPVGILGLKRQDQCVVTVSSDGNSITITRS